MDLSKDYLLFVLCNLFLLRIIRSLLLNRKGQVIVIKLRIGHDKLTCSRLIIKNEPKKCNRYNFILSVDYRLNRSNVSQQKIKFALSNEIQICLYRKG